MARLQPLSPKEKSERDRIVGALAKRVISQEKYFLGKLLYFGGYLAVKDYLLGVLPHNSAIELIDTAEAVWEHYEERKAYNNFFANKDYKSFSKVMENFNRTEIE